MSRAILNQLAPASRLYWDYQMIAVFNVSVPIDLFDVAGTPDFSAVRMDDGDRRLVVHNTSCRCLSLYRHLHVHPKFSKTRKVALPLTTTLPAPLPLMVTLWS